MSSKIFEERGYNLNLDSLTKLVGWLEKLTI